MALSDLNAYEEGGVDGLFLENNYGLSGEKISATQAVAMGYLVDKIRSATTLPLGVSVLWNDYETAFALAKTYDLDFIRVPVFVDEVEAYCGRIVGNSDHVKKVQAELEAHDIAVFTDILVKHSKHISPHSLEESAEKAISSGSDALIVTGDWTGEPPNEHTIANLKNSVGNFPIFVGSGANTKNVDGLLRHADGVIVSTSLKEGETDPRERNVKSFTQRVSRSKVKAFMKAINEKHE